MAFDIRCPKCRAKLRLEKQPDAGTPMECPKCGEKFAAPATAEKDDKKVDTKGGKDETAKEAKKPRAVKTQGKRVHFNPLLMLGIVGGLMFVLIATLSVIMFVMNKAGKVEDMLVILPDQMNTLRGVNVSQMKKFPGFKAEGDRYVTADVQAAYDELATAAGLRGGGDTLNYYMSAKERISTGDAGEIVFFRSDEPISFAKLAAGLGGATSQQSNGTPYLQVANNDPVPYLRGAAVFCPNDRLFCVVRPHRNGGAYLSALTGPRKAFADTVAGKIGTAGKKASRGTVWLVVRPVGGHSGYLQDLAATVAPLKELPRAAEAVGGASCLGVWVTFSGNGARFNAAIECSDKETAKKLVAGIREGPLNKGDEYEPSHELKKALPLTAQKGPFGEFMQYVQFEDTNECAQLKAKIGNKKTYDAVMTTFNSPVMGGG